MMDKPSFFIEKQDPLYYHLDKAEKRRVSRSMSLESLWLVEKDVGGLVNMVLELLPRY